MRAKVLLQQLTHQVRFREQDLTLMLVLLRFDVVAGPFHLLLLLQEWRAFEVNHRHKVVVEHHEHRLELPQLFARLLLACPMASIVYAIQ